MRSGVITYQRTLVAVALVSLALAGCSGAEEPAATARDERVSQGGARDRTVVGPLSEADAAALATMNDRLKEYVDLHRQARARAAEAADRRRPQIDTNQRVLEAKVREARTGAKPGDIFTPEARPVIKRLLASRVRRPRRQAVEGVDHGREPGRRRASSSPSTAAIPTPCR